MFAGILGMLLGVGRMFFALCMVSFAMMLSSGAVGLRRILVMLSCLVVVVSSHWISPGEMMWSDAEPGRFDPALIVQLGLLLGRWLNVVTQPGHFS